MEPKLDVDEQFKALLRKIIGHMQTISRQNKVLRDTLQELTREDILGPGMKEIVYGHQAASIASRVLKENPEPEEPDWG